jgi:hypothetical protein
MVGEEYTYVQLVDQAHYDEHIREKIKYYPARKYKKVHNTSSDENKEVGSGTRVIAEALGSGSTILGYLLCVVIDIQDDHSFWSENTKFILQAIDASSESMMPEVGRIRSASMKNRGWCLEKLSIVEIGKENWEDYKI